jgi:hypothetical protein
MTFGYRAYARFRLFVEQHDVPYRLLVHSLARWRPKQKRNLATKDTEIVLEGFPRSANTYMYWFFVTAQQREVKVGHHLHSSYQIRTAVRYGIPCVFLIRDPLDCVASAILRDARMDAGTLLRAYRTLYSAAVHYADDMLIVPQKAAVEDPNLVIKAINERFGRAFDTLPQERLNEVYERINARHLSDWKLSEPDPTRLALPSAQKEAAKEPIAEAIRKQHAALLEECQTRFESLRRLAWKPELARNRE